MIDYAATARARRQKIADRITLEINEAQVALNAAVKANDGLAIASYSETVNILERERAHYL